MATSFEANVESLLTHLLDIGCDITPNKEGKQGFMIWNFGEVKSTIDQAKLDNVDGWKLLPKPKSLSLEGTIVPERAYLGPVSNRKAPTIGDLMAKATK